MKQSYVRDLTPDHPVRTTFLVQSKERKVASNGSAYLDLEAAMDRLTAPPDVLEFIASKIQTNIRELEGALIRVTAFASLNRQPVDLTLAEIVLKDLIPEGGEPEITAALIIAQAARHNSRISRSPSACIPS